MPEITLIKPSVQLIEESDLLKSIELCGRTCYKSEERITDGSAEKFVKMLVSRRHTAMCEAGTVYLKNPQGVANGPMYDIQYSKFSHVEYDDDYAYITTNFRVILESCENDYDKAIAFVKKHAMQPTDKHEKRISFRIICDRGVTHELVRHRVFSFGQESTRYVKYGEKQPFRFIEPSWWEEKISNKPIKGQLTVEHELFLKACQTAADIYSQLLELGQTAQQARAVLPNAIKTEIVMTGTVSQWKAFLALRTAPTAHPDMQIIAKQIEALLKSIGVIVE